MAPFAVPLWSYPIFDPPPRSFCWKGRNSAPKEDPDIHWLTQTDSAGTKALCEREVNAMRKGAASDGSARDREVFCYGVGAAMAPALRRSRCVTQARRFVAQALQLLV